MTYQLLLVDDERVAIEGVKADLDFEKLCISRLFTAMNIRQAKEIFTSEAVDILLCDIEMPKGNGLELLSWVREHYPNTVAIFLTSHADFKYAKEAMRLGSLDYLLKPVQVDELEHTIRKAQNLIEEQGESNRNRQSHRLWMKHHLLIIERFWHDLINWTIPSNPAAIREQVERHQIPITEDSVFLPVLISVHRWDKELQPRDEIIMEYALKKTADEMMMHNQENGIVFNLGRQQLLALYVSDSLEQWDYDRVHDVCRQYIHFCNRHFYCKLSCYVGKSVEVHQMADRVEYLQAQDRENVAFVNQVFGEEGMVEHNDSVDLPDLNVWLSYMKNGTQEEVIQGVEKFLNSLIEKRILDAQLLHQFHQDFMQALYSFLNMNEIQAHQLYGDRESKRLTEMAGRSLQDMMNWVRHAIGKAIQQAEVVKKSESVIGIIKKYVAANIDQDLTRDKLAEQVFLNPDYLSRVFKKETGYSLSDYVFQERIKVAKKLLVQSDIPISAISVSVGNSNSSHFAKMFKKYVGVEPSKYRSQHRQS